MKCAWGVPFRTATSENVVEIPELKDGQGSALWCGLNFNFLSRFRDSLK